MDTLCFIPMALLKLFITNLRKFTPYKLSNTYFNPHPQYEVAKLLIFHVSFMGEICRQSTRKTLVPRHGTSTRIEIKDALRRK